MSNNEATLKQIGFIISLTDQAFNSVQDAVSARKAVVREIEAGKLTKKRASDMIQRLLELKNAEDTLSDTTDPVTEDEDKRKVEAKKDLTWIGEVPDGHFALETKEGLKFFSIRSGNEDSKWAGWQFFSAVAGPEEYRLGTIKDGKYKGKSWESLKEIRDNPIYAMGLYGQHVGNCGVCNRRLTDELSRERGIGPVCYDKL